MKSSTMMAIAFCGVLACAVTGCKYDDDSLPPDENNNTIVTGTDINTDDPNGPIEGKDVPTDGQDVANGGGALANAGADLNDIKDDEGNPATGLPFDEDPNYTRCTDVNFEPVYFAFDASTLQPSEMAKIEAVAAHLKQTGRVVMVEGNCDERGSNEYNLSLGQIRAIAIQKYLVSLGVKVESAQAKSYGEEKPAVVGHDESAWSKNRRGEFAVFAHK